MRDERRRRAHRQRPGLLGRRRHLRVRGPRPGGDPRATTATTGGVYEELAALPQPTIAAIHGYCLGGGLELALATDFRIADDTAVFGFPRSASGSSPSSGGTYRATRLLGPARAKELILLCERFGADEALALGLVTEVVEEARRSTRALELRGRLAALPRDAVAVDEEAIDAAADAPRDAALLIERLAYGAARADAGGAGRRRRLRQLM